MPRIPTIKTKFPSQAYIQTRGPMAGSTRRFRYEPGRNGDMVLMKGPDNLWWETEYEPLQGPDLPRNIEKYRQQMIDAMESGNDGRKLSRMRAYEDAVANERARQAYNRKLIENAVRLRKEELWRDYYQNGEGFMDAITPRQMKMLDSEFDNRARWQVRGIEDPEDPYGWSDMDEAEFREYYKDAPWRLW